MKSLLAIADRIWPVTRRAMKLHTTVYTASGGRIGHRFPGTPPMLLLHHTGAKSNAARTDPLVYIRDGQDLVLVASKGGHPRNPAWFHNLRAHPDVAVQVGREQRAVRARVARANERERLWRMAVATYGGYRTYQERTDREIPLVVLEPREAP